MVLSHSDLKSIEQPKVRGTALQLQTCDPRLQILGLLQKTSLKNSNIIKGNSKHKNVTACLTVGLFQNDVAY